MQAGGERLPKTTTPTTRSSLKRVLDDVAAERERQDAKYGPEVLEHGTGGEAQVAIRDRLQRQTTTATKAGTVTRGQIIQTELAEALAETEYGPLREELVQVAASAVAFVQQLDDEQEARLERQRQDEDEA